LNLIYMHTKNRLYKFLPALYLLIFMSLDLSAQDQPKPIINANLSGEIIDSVSNLPLEGVTLQLEQVTHQVKTDANGHFKFVTGQKLPLTLTISRIGYHTKRLTVKETPIIIALQPRSESISQVVVTSRRRTEKLQDIPIPITTINGKTMDDAGAFNVSRIKEMVPSVQLYSSNPRNTTLNIRGLGSTFGLTNDGIDPGVGFYLDGVYMARPAATALDFIDIEQIEVLRGPQGTLFGMNTTSGAFNITSRLPKFDPDLLVELSYGNYGFIQGKASISGPITEKLAARISFSGTQRNGTVENIYTNRAINSTNNLGFRGQLLYKPNDKTNILIAADRSIQQPDGFGWGVAGVVQTQRAAYRQFQNIIDDIGYKLPYSNAFERKVDLNTESKAENELGGVSVNADFKIGSGTLTSTSAWRYWKWVPLNDRDYLGLPVFTVSAGNSSHDQYSQEFRYSGNLGEKISAVVGLFGLYQDLRTDPVHTEEAGSSLWRFAKILKVTYGKLLDYLIILVLKLIMD
ncbi:MAG: TonB-dependent receptor, partial [Sphingobacterium sp.]